VARISGQHVFMKSCFY